MKTKMQSILCALLLSLAPAGAQSSWTLTTTMTATLDSKGTFTVSTTREGGEAMPDYNSYYYSAERTPWRDVCGKIFAAVLEPGVTRLGNHVLGYCNNLTSVTLPESLTSIGYGAFLNCTSLPSITIPAAATSVESEVFGGCTSLASAVIHASTVTGFGGTAINSVAFGPTVKHIGESAFVDCRNLVSVEIPGSVEIVDNSAFRGCSSLVSAVIGDSVVTIGQDAFAGTSLTSVEIPHSVVNIGSTPFRDCGSLATVVVRPPSIGNAFSGLSLTSLTLGDSVQTLGVNAFAGCRSLKSVAFGKALATIGSNAFNGCTSLEQVEIPSPVKTVGASAFQGCTALSAVSIPSSVAEMGANAFQGCRLADVGVSWPSPLSITAGVFGGVNLSASTLHVPYGAKALYEAAPVWKDFNRIEEASPVWNLTATMTATLDENGALTVRTTKAGGEAMPDFDGTAPPWSGIYLLVKSVVIEEGVTGIGNYAFYRHDSIASVALPSSLAKIGEAAFDGCTRLVSLSAIPASVTSIGKGALMDCSALTAIEVEAANPAYSSEDGVLYNKSRTELLTVPAGKTGTFTVPATVHTLADYAFFGCDRLTGVDIPNAVTTVGQYTFYCRNLRDVTVHWDEPLAAGEYAFHDVDLAAATLHVPHGTKALYEAAPVWKDFGSIEEEEEEEGGDTGSEAVAPASLRVYALAGSLHISSATSCTVSIYTPAGRLVKQLYLPAGETASAVLPRGVYIVKAGGETRKAAVR
jgi:hypothetical protein